MALHSPLTSACPLHVLLLCCNLCSHTIKTILSFRHHPAWCLQFTAHIAESKDAAARIIQAQINDVCIYSNRSGYNDNISAASIIPKMGQALQFKLAKALCHTVFEGELVGVLLALYLLACQCKIHSALIALDNQAAITML